MPDTRIWDETLTVPVLSKGKIFLFLFVSAVSCFCERKSGAHDTPVQQKERWNLVLEKDLSIGDAGAAPNTFSRIMPIRKDQPTIAVDENERIYVLDYKECLIKLFDRAGNHIETFGGKGQGPGELDAPLSLSISSTNKEIMVYDSRIRRLHFFTLDGDYMNSISTATGSYSLKFVYDAHGNILGLKATNRSTEILYEICIFDRHLKPLRTIASYTHPVSLLSMHVFTPTLHYTIYQDNLILYGFPDLYKLIFVDYMGNEVKSIEKDHALIEVTAEERESFLKNFPSYANIRVPAYHNAYRYFTVDDEGRIFVQTWEKTKNGKGYYHDVFDDRGNYMAGVPLEICPILWKKKKLYTIEEDESGVHILKRYKVLWQRKGE